MLIIKESRREWGKIALMLGVLFPFSTYAVFKNFVFGTTERFEGGNKFIDFIGVFAKVFDFRWELSTVVFTFVCIIFLSILIWSIIKIIYPNTVLKIDANKLEIFENPAFVCETSEISKFQYRKKNKQMFLDIFFNGNKSKRSIALGLTDKQKLEELEALKQYSTFEEV